MKNGTARLRVWAKPWAAPFLGETQGQLEARGLPGGLLKTAGSRGLPVLAPGPAKRVERQLPGRGVELWPARQSRAGGKRDRRLRLAGSAIRTSQGSFDNHPIASCGELLRSRIFVWSCSAGLPQPPYFCGGQRRGCSFGLSAHIGFTAPVVVQEADKDGGWKSQLRRNQKVVKADGASLKKCFRTWTSARF